MSMPIPHVHIIEEDSEIEIADWPVSDGVPSVGDYVEGNRLVVRVRENPDRDLLGSVTVFVAPLT